MADYAPVDLATAEQVTFELDGRRVSAPAGTMLVDAAYAHGVEVPVFCYEPRLGPAIGACRMCLVEVEGTRGLQTACSTPVQADMVVRTSSPVARDAQEGVLELILANHPLDCPVCDKGGECPLMNRTFRFGPGRTRFVEGKRHFPKPLEISSLIHLDRERCIQCFRCTRFSQDVAEDEALIMEDRGAGSEIATFTGEAYEGRFTGNVIDLCPVGALTSIPYRFVSRPWDVANAPSVCTHCPVGCNTDLTSREGRVRRVTGRTDPNYAVEEGWLCDKGRFAYPGDWAPDRLSGAVIRDAERSREATLDDAVDAAALLLRHSDPPPLLLLGPGASVEEGFLAQVLAESALSGNGAGGARVARLGVPGAGLIPLRALPGAQLGDLDESDLVAVVGGDPAHAQPVAELRVRKARRRGAAVWCAGPRPHALEPLGRSVRTAPGRLVQAVEALRAPLGDAARPVVLWDEADLAGEPEAAAALAALLAEHPTARAIELAADVGGPGLRALGIASAADLPAEARAGRVGTVLAIHADPLVGAGAGEWEDALAHMGNVIAIATHASPLTELANVVLPAASAYEQEGVFVSMARRAQRTRPGAEPPQGAAPAWEMLIALAHRLGTPPAYRTPAQAFAAAAAACPALAGLSYDVLGAEGAPIGPEPERREPAAGTGAPAGPDALPLVPCPRIFGDAATHRSDALAGVRTSARLLLAPAEAARRNLRDGGRARVAAPGGAARLEVVVDEAYPEGAAFVATGPPGVARILPADHGPAHVTLSPDEAAG
jgi:NADH-quinone oxidoreductase subunit G